MLVTLLLPVSYVITRLVIEILLKDSSSRPRPMPGLETKTVHLCLQITDQHHKLHSAPSGGIVNDK